jgi:hypothetical protein
MEAMYWLGVGIGNSARLAVQGINTGWFEWCGWVGLCRWLTVQGINSEWFDRSGWTGRRRPLRPAIGGGRRRVGGRSGGGSGGGIAGFLAVYLTDMVGISNRSDKESHSAATARSPPGGFRDSAPRPSPVQA